MIIIKLGGSVITRKGDYATLNNSVLESISHELSCYEGGEQMIIVHGAGSFGHILARKYRLKNPSRTAELPMNIAKVQKDVRNLNLMVMNSLIDHGIPAISVPPALCSELVNGELVSFEDEKIKKFLDLGAVPVTFGDVVYDETRGVSILSGDTIMEHLAKEFGAKNAIFVLDVDGFFDKPPNETGAQLYGKLDVDSLEGILASSPVSSKDISEVVDITGSIRGKMESALRIARTGTDTYLVNGQARSRLSSILNGNPTVSTMIEGVTG